MEAQKDFKELLELFNGHKVEYIIVGAYALAYHGAPRFTGDIDILVKLSLENAKRILSKIILPSLIVGLGILKTPLFLQLPTFING